jgi:hypothetical protein
LSEASLPNFYILDTRDVWHMAACEAATAHGYKARRIFNGSEVDGDGLGFIRTHADWRVLPKNRHDDALMRLKLTMIQDRAQVEVYEDKSEQFRRWGEWMPDTWRFTHKDVALTFLDSATYPLVSKADVGASSVNVRILENKAQAAEHIERLFGEGIKVNHGAACPLTKQKGYALLQRFIPHNVTYRVNAIGDCRAVFFRYCYPDRPVAQTGNVEPAFEMTAEVESLLEYANLVFSAIGSKWCALDILKDGDEWRLIETSLAWPWPSPGRCNEGAIFGSGKQWISMFDVMFDEVERGAWA